MSSVFTKILSGELPGRFVWKDESCFAILSANPLRPGHVLVIPHQEVDDWLDLPEPLRQHLFAAAHVIGQALRVAFQPVKVGVAIVGLEVRHVHLHLIPISAPEHMEFARAEKHPDPLALDAAAEKVRAALATAGAPRRPAWLSPSMTRKKNTQALETLLDWAGKRVVDVGCGEGHLVRLLAQRGARVTGLEVQPAQLERAKAAERVRDEDYLEAGAQAMPLPDGTVDVIVFFNSLHHVPVALMPQAVAEAARVLKPGGWLYVSEPVAEGAFFELVRPVDDETEVRARAAEALRGAGEVGLERRAEERFLHPVVLEGFEGFRRRVVGADGTRAAKVADMEPVLRAALERLGRKTEAGWEFEQPTQVDVFVKRGASRAPRPATPA